MRPFPFGMNFFRIGYAIRESKAYGGKFMKRALTLLLVFCLTATCLAGCRMGGVEDTTPTLPTEAPTAPTTEPTEAPTGDTALQGSASTQSAKILINIWSTYTEDERFAVYGGAVENSVSDGPGDLDMKSTEELTTRYLVPEDQLATIREGASLVHMMNNNIFTAVVFQLADEANESTLAKALRDNLQKNQWICGQPDKLLIAEMEDDRLLMAFGSKDAMDTFRGKLMGVYADTKILYEENITA